MKNKQTLQLAKTQSPMNAVRAAVKPPPSRATVLLATATALYREEIALSLRIQNEKAEMKKDLDAKVLKALKPIQHLKPRLSYRATWRDGATMEVVEAELVFTGEIDALLKKYRMTEVPKARTIEAIQKGLRENLAYEAEDAAESLLNDPDVKEKLLEFGRRLLNTTAPSQKSKAIPV